MSKAATNSPLGQKVRHASRSSDMRAVPLCGDVGRTTRPKEIVNCPDCRMILNHIRGQYPEHAGHTDWRLTASENRAAAERMVADMYGGTDD